MSGRKFLGPVPHWNNFTLLELREILEHCAALERLGIAQDEKMISSISRDISMREKKVKRRQEGLNSERTTQTPTEDYLMVPNV